ncbi:MAG: aryl-sulfate sulfotransferase [Flavobacterium sp. JAD_PAG50586_2]|nr:MAG: aryl-sulfate sulfotransferase [Flavobacterium sp. JAD_PAG50586_2]
MKSNINIAKKSCYVLILIVFYSCVNDGYINSDNKLSSIELSTGAIYPAFDPGVKDYYCTSLNTLKTFQVTLNDFEASKTIYINGVKVTGKVTSLKLNPGEDIVIQSGYHPDEMLTYTVHYLPVEMPKANLITKNNPSEGYILVSLFEMGQPAKDYSYLGILNNDGFPVYYKKVPYGAVFNFKYFDTPNGKRFSYNTTNDIGKAVIMDENFEEIKRLDLLPHNGHGVLPTDNHDFLYLDDNHYILPTYTTRENVDMTAYGGSSSVDIGEFVFQEIQDNNVIFEWDTANFPELLGATDPIYYAQYATAGKVDYFHFNSINIDPNDNNFVLSARHTNQIYKINRTTGAIMWRFGGSDDDFNLTGNQVISHPHHATILPNGHLLLFDNGVTKTPRQSRIAEFALNVTTMTASLVFEYKDEGRYFDIMGSAQKLSNGNYLIGWGGNITSQTNANKSDVTEINANGNIILDISFSNNPNSFSYSYRALKYNITF